MNLKKKPVGDLRGTIVEERNRLTGLSDSRLQGPREIKASRMAHTKSRL